jgi:hypothetical protein
MSILKENVVRLAHKQSELDARSRDLRSGGDDPLALSDVQAEFNETYKSIDTGGAPPPRYNESVDTYRARLADELKRFSPRWARADLFAMEPAMLAEAGQAIRQDVQRVVDNPAQPDFADPSKLRRCDKVDPETGQRTIEWRGSMASFISNFNGFDQFCRKLGNSKPVFKWIGD